MKDKKFSPVRFAAIALVLVGLACNLGAPAEPTVSNIHMATDKDDTNQTTVFAPTNDFFVHFDVGGIEVGTPFQSRWYALDIEGEDPNTPFQTIDYAYEEGIGNIYFQLTNANGWPVGNYKVEIYMNGTKAGEQQFSVQ